MSDLESLKDYVYQYAQRNLYDECSQKNLLDKLLEKHPYLDPDYVGGLEGSIGRETPYAIQPVKQNCFNHNFRREMESTLLIDEQQ